MNPNVRLQDHGMRSACAICGRWSFVTGASMCGVCRSARAIAYRPFDSRLSTQAYHHMLEILDQTVGKNYCLLATGLPCTCTGAYGSPSCWGERKTTTSILGRLSCPWERVPCCCGKALPDTEPETAREHIPSQEPRRRKLATQEEGTKQEEEPNTEHKWDSWQNKRNQEVQFQPHNGKPPFEIDTRPPLPRRIPYSSAQVRNSQPPPAREDNKEEPSPAPAKKRKKKSRGLTD